MTRRNAFSTNIVSMRELLANGKKYVVPRFQRNYSWTEEQCEDLWNDILAIENSEASHYMGALVLVEDEIDHFTIIDGQQRIATLSLLALAAMYLLSEQSKWESEDGRIKKQIGLLQSSFAGSTSPVTLITEPKLTLNAMNREFFENYLLRLRRPPSVANLTKGDELLWNGLQFFRDRLAKKFPKPEQSGDLTEFIFSTVATSIRFLVLRVENELSAYTIFETLNARGIDLTPGDLLKNYLFSLVDKEGTATRARAEQVWNTVLGRTGAANLPKVLRHHLCSVNPGVIRLDHLFRTVRSSVASAEAVFPLLDALDEASLVCEALEDSDHRLWLEAPGANKYVANLILYQVTQYRPLVLAAWRRLSRAELTKILRICDVISFRYNVIGRRNPNLLESAYSDVAVAIETGNVTSAREVRNKLREVYVSDDEFVESFSRASLATGGGTRSKLVRHVLGMIERQMHKAHIDTTTTNLTVEHVLPQKLNDVWLPYFNAEKHERYVDRIGNYVLLEPSINHDLKDSASFAQKMKSYRESGVTGTRELEYSEWTPAVIEERQRKMAQVAKSVWRLDDMED